MGFFSSVFKRNLEIRDMLELDLAIDPAERSYLKRMALESVINFISRTFSQSEFWVKDGQELKEDTLYYKLNVRPNSDSSASDFWHKVIYKLIYDNEVLIIKSDSDELLIADDFYREEYAVYEDIFKDVVVKDYKFGRTFKMSEVIYFNYNNDKLQRFVESLFADYGELFGRMMDTQLRKNQIRGVVSVNSGAGNIDNIQMTRLQKYIDKIYNQFKNNGVAIVPEISGFEYKELSKDSVNGTDNGAENLQKLKRMIIDDVAKIVGIPSNLIHGDVADLSNAMDAYIDFCINPLISKIEDELNSKFFTEAEYLKGKRVKVVGINAVDPIKNAEKVDKLISSSAAKQNEVRELLGLAPVEDGDRFILTKNYQTEEALKGGANENDDETRTDENSV
ncbi:phage portal protein [Staphylococcus pseudintermedius]|uniref:phage portal protein n=1 Tax=Staphylococcus pseudintermedius TaxID=283734 RepID=UPI000C1BC383|nr:phage portal protein [Staphylococcus pseudintermedius]EGQ0314119.1 phage portal protein [Staphylococcus pseudintermedius]EGQ0379308.1 phage portal protein [Staphylococcus pseudintermedius]EGQ0389623.1 phage portal protein [Staphylococcus pseudintermedius]EGQ1640321.1 phage portal protein [Staphylococcus pseudintermedius]EGQ1675942.1 phage portal protein [Staphylococcus pseudintermedius]